MDDGADVNAAGARVMRDRVVGHLSRNSQTFRAVVDNRERDFIQRYNRLYRRPCMLAAWLSKLTTWLKNR